jgi:hypothetical protein
MEGRMRTRLTWAAVVLAGIFLGSPAGARQEGEPQPAAGDAKTRAADKHLFDALRDVINTGRDLYNKQGDYSGCYRVFQGALLTVKPLLAHRPDLQKAIENGLADAEVLSYTHERAFALRKVLDTVRAGLKTGEAVVAVPEKIGAPKSKGGGTQPEVIAKPKGGGTQPELIAKPKGGGTQPELIAKPKGGGAQPELIEKPKGEQKKETAEKAGVTGKVVYQGQPLPAGTVTFHKAKDHYAAMIYSDGTYEVKDLPPGSYVIAVETASVKESKKDPPPQFVAIPAQYADPQRSSLTVELRAGKNTFDLNLK